MADQPPIDPVLLSDGLPAHARVRYRRAPLERVYVQLRFDPRLELSTQIPVEFHKAIRESFPQYEQQQRVTLGPGAQPASAAVEAVHHFHNRAQTAKIALTSRAVSFDTGQYTVFEELRKSVVSAMNALRACHGVEEFTRVGLRYVDRIPLPAPGGLALTDAIARPLVAVHADPRVGAHVRASLAELHVDFGGGVATLRHGLQLDGDSDSPRESYLLDTDYWRQEVLDHARTTECLDRFHEFAWRFFRWCIQDRLHEALEPEPLG